MSNPRIAFGIASVGYAGYWVGSVSSATSKVNEVVTATITGGRLSSDPRVLPIVANGTERAMVNSYTYSSGVGTQGSALYGIYDPTASAWTTPVAKAQCNQASPVTGVQVWHASNPYSIVAVDGTMYLNDYDTAKIYEYDMTGDAFSEAQDPVYTFVPGGEYKAGGVALDLYSSGSNNYLVAAFTRYTNSGWTYTYGPSELVMINLLDYSDTSLSVEANVNGVVVEGEYGYATAFGGAQVAAGNVNTTLKVYTLTSGTPVFKATLNSAALPQSFVGDYLDVAFANSKAYVLVAKYNVTYSQYDYMIIQTTAGNLQNGTFGSNVKYVTHTASPASPTFALLPDGNDLYLVDGVKVCSINTAVDIDATGALTQWCAASDFTFVSGTTTYTGYLFNTVGLVVEKTLATRSAKAAAKAHVTKMSKRLLTPEEIKHMQGKEK